MRMRPSRLALLAAFACACVPAAHPATTTTVAEAPPQTRPATSDATPEVPRRGSLPANHIRGVITANIDAIRACYEAILRGREPAPTGRVVTRFVIAADGRMQHVEIKPEQTTLEDPALHACMLDAMGAFQFDAPDGGGVVIVTYPFSFNVSDDDAEHAAETPTSIPGAGDATRPVP